jgi:hypothetical protein
MQVRFREVAAGACAGLIVIDYSTVVSGPM